MWGYTTRAPRRFEARVIFKGSRRRFGSAPLSTMAGVSFEAALGRRRERCSRLRARLSPWGGGTNEETRDCPSRGGNSPASPTPPILPTTKAPEEKPKPNCCASIWDWLNASASDCPLSAYGITLYGTLRPQRHLSARGRRQEPEPPSKVNYSIQRNATVREQMARGLQRPQRLGDRPQDEGRPGPRRSAGAGR